MKKLILPAILFCALAITSCSINEDDLSTKKPELLNRTYVFGNKSKIEKAINDNILHDLILKSRESRNDWIIGCYENVNTRKETKKFIDHGASNRMTFQTLVGDEYITGNNDPDAISREQVLEYDACTTQMEDVSEKAYINVIIDESTNPNKWATPILLAIQNWNEAMNNGQYNEYLHGSPNLYFRIANEPNFQDYDNIIIRSENDSDLDNPGAYAEALTGYYIQIAPGIFSHNVGSNLYINLDKEDQLSFSQKITVIVHELGHTLGFLHTNGQAANIEDTTQNAPSVMSQGSIPWNGFSDQDLIGIDRIFNIDTDIIILCNGTIL